MKQAAFLIAFAAAGVTSAHGELLDCHVTAVGDHMVEWMAFDTDAGSWVIVGDRFTLTGADQDVEVSRVSGEIKAVVAGATYSGRCKIVSFQEQVAQNAPATP